MGDQWDVPALLADVAAIGPFFAVATGSAPAGAGWVPVRALSADAGPADARRTDARRTDARRTDARRTDALSDRIAAVRAALCTDDRVAASIAFQGLAAQLVAPLFAAAVVRRALPAAGPASGVAGGVAAALHWRPGGPGPWLWWAGGGRVVPCPDATALGPVLDGLLAPLVAVVRSRVSVSERVLWGDAASAVASARRLVCAARPAASARSTDVARALLARAPLAATVALRPAEPPDAHWTFRRRSCCLYHRAPGGGLCDDCVLRERRPRAR